MSFHAHVLILKLPALLKQVKIESRRIQTQGTDCASLNTENETLNCSFNWDYEIRIA